MINEVQRQAYLSAIGIENYMPRVILPFAPPSIVCNMPVLVETPSAQQSNNNHITASSDLRILPELPAQIKNTVVSDILADVVFPKKSPALVNAATILQELKTKKAPTVEPFTLGLWRPVPGFLIIDSRNTSLALPTELLLNNLLRNVLSAQKFDLREEVMRWPMIENRFVSSTADDARNELQTWLAVENELCPINRLWLMGPSATRYFLKEDVEPSHVYWQEQELTTLGNDGNLLHALILPSLVELLQQPLFKARLWAVLN